MQMRTAKLLHDCLSAAREIQQLIGNESVESYVANRVLRLAVERLFEITGESMNLALQSDPSLRERIPVYRQVIGLRNKIIHGYEDVNDAAIWDVATTHLPLLVLRLEDVMRDAPVLPEL